MSAVTHPLDTKAGRQRFILGRCISTLGLVVVSAGLLFLAADSMLWAVTILAVGVLCYIGGSVALKRSWDYVSRGAERGHEPVWMFVGSWILSTVPLGYSLLVLAGSGQANAAVAAVIAVALLSEVVTSLRKRSAPAPLERTLDLIQSAVWITVLIRVVLMFTA